MKNKFSLLVSGAAVLALMACSSLEVSNPEEENYPAGWSVAEYIKVNPDLRALQIMDQVTIWNASSGFASDEAEYLANTTLLQTIATNYANFGAQTVEQITADKDKLKYLKAFNMYGVANEPAVFDTLTLDTNAIAMQYVAYGKREGRPYRSCAATEANIAKGNCQSDANSYFDAHLYCSLNGVTYCIDCAATEKCAVVVPTSSASETPASSETATDPATPAADPATPAATPESSASAEPATPAEP